MTQINKLKLGPITLDASFLQASLAGYTDVAMRSIAMEYGAPLTFSGVIPAEALLRSKALSRPGLAIDEGMHPVGAQIMGWDPEKMALAAKILVDFGYDVIDLNFACPMRKVLRRREGGFMLKEPDQLIKVFRSVREAVKCPILMKLRSGFSDNPESQDKFFEICERASTEGVDALIVHGRSVEQRYRGQADWDIVAKVRRLIPKTILIGSGDLMNAGAIFEKIASGVVDGVAVARGAIGNPWIFNEVRALLEGRPMPQPPTLVEQGELILRHFKMVDELFGGSRVTLFHKYNVRYVKRHPTPKKARVALLESRDHEEFRLVVKQLYGLC
jgi:tRNA-dihydrouridine synthase B